MAELIAKDDGERVIVPDERLAEELASGLYELPAGETVRVIDENTGQAIEVAADDLADYAGSYDVRAETPEEFRAQEDVVRIDREHGDLAGKALTVLESGANAATLGAYGAAARALASDEYLEDMRERRQANPGTATTVDILGAAAPALLSGGTGILGAIARSTPAGMAARAGARVAERGLIRGMATEGALFGAGQGIQDVMLSEEPLTLERFGSAVGSGVLYGAGIGGGMGIFAKAAGKGIKKAKKLADDAAERFRSPGAGVSDDLASLDKAGLKEARLAEQRATGAAIVEDFKAYRALADEVDPMLIAQGRDKGTLFQAKKTFQKALKTPKTLSKRPGNLQQTLEAEELVLRDLLEKQDDLLAKLTQEDDALARKLRKLDSNTLMDKDAKRFADWRGKSISTKQAKKGLEITASEMADFRRALASGEVKGARAKTAEGLAGLLDRNRAAQQSIDDLITGSTPRLQEISIAQDMLSAGGKPKGLVEKTVEGSVFGAVTGATAPILGPAAPIFAGKVSSKLSDLVLGRLAKAGAESSQRTAKAIEAFMAAGEAARPAAPPLATKILNSVAFGPEPSNVANALAKGGKKKGLLAAFQDREQEILAQTMQGPDGPKMRPGARRDVADRLSGVRAASPVLADHIETVAARRVEFLASKLPRRPDVMAMPVGPDNWRPSDMEIRAFARYVAAVEDPGGVEERVASGQLTPEDAEAMRAVYPERFEDFKRQIIEKLPELRANLPYERRLALSMFSGVPVDPAMDPRILAVLQGSFAEEPGSEGGTQAPRAQPQFGSISRPKPTAAQERAG